MFEILPQPNIFHIVSLLAFIILFIIFIIYKKKW